MFKDYDEKAIFVCRNCGEANNAGYLVWQSEEKGYDTCEKCGGAYIYSGKTFAEWSELYDQTHTKYEIKHATVGDVKKFAAETMRETGLLIPDEDTLRKRAEAKEKFGQYGEKALFVCRSCGEAHDARYLIAIYEKKEIDTCEACGGAYIYSGKTYAEWSELYDQTHTKREIKHATVGDVHKFAAETMREAGLLDLDEAAIKRAEEFDKRIWAEIYANSSVKCPHCGSGNVSSRLETIRDSISDIMETGHEYTCNVCGHKWWSQD